MRTEPFFVNDYVHIFNRGNRKQEIVRDDRDRQHFLLALYYLNTEHTPFNPFRDLSLLKLSFNKYARWSWPSHWRSRDPLVEVIMYTLMDNHFHLLLKEIKEGGIARFMHKLSISMTKRFNTRYDEVGSLFQWTYKAKCVDDENYLRYLCAYIQIKNGFERFSKNLSTTFEHFDNFYTKALDDPYNSLSTFSGAYHLPILVQDNLVREMFPKNDFKEFARVISPKLLFDETKMVINRVET